MAITKAHAVWDGNLGKGSMTLPKGGFTGPFTKASRFENGEGTNHRHDDHCLRISRARNEVNNQKRGRRTKKRGGAENRGNRKSRQ